MPIGFVDVPRPRRAPAKSRRASVVRAKASSVFPTPCALPQLHDACRGHARQQEAGCRPQPQAGPFTCFPDARSGRTAAFRRPMASRRIATRPIRVRLRPHERRPDVACQRSASRDGYAEAADPAREERIALAPSSALPAPSATTSSTAIAVCSTALLIASARLTRLGLPECATSHGLPMNICFDSSGPGRPAPHAS